MLVWSTIISKSIVLYKYRLRTLLLVLLRGHIPLPVCTHSPSLLLSGNSLAETWRRCNPSAANLWMSIEWGSMGTRGYPGHSSEKHLRSAGRQVSNPRPGLLRRPAWYARNVSSPPGQPRHKGWVRRGTKTRRLSQPKQRTCVGPGLCVMVYILWCDVNVVRVMVDLI